MKRIFLSFSFRDEDRDLVTQVEQLLASHDVNRLTGKRLGGEALTPAVMNLIDQSDGLVALMTRRDQLAAGGWTTHQWVHDELNHARNGQKRAIALVETNVDLGGAYAEHERIALDRANPLSAFLALSETIGIWKRAAGRQLKVRIMPDLVGQQAAQQINGTQCRYRFVTNGATTIWQEIIPVLEQGGTFVYIGGIQEDYMIQLSVENGAAKWQSPACPQWMPIELAQLGGN
jgi:hypothetical protein